MVVIVEEVVEIIGAGEEVEVSTGSKVSGTRVVTGGVEVDSVEMGVGSTSRVVVSLLSVVVDVVVVVTRTSPLTLEEEEVVELPKFFLLFLVECNTGDSRTWTVSSETEAVELQSELVLFFQPSFADQISANRESVPLPLLRVIPLVQLPVEARKGLARY